MGDDLGCLSGEDEPPYPKLSLSTMGSVLCGSYAIENVHYQQTSSSLIAEFSKAQADFNILAISFFSVQ
jgi:hypothetical protein